MAILADTCAGTGPRAMRVLLAHPMLKSEATKTAGDRCLDRAGPLARLRRRWSHGNSRDEAVRLFPEPPPQVAWADVEARRLETSDGQQLGAWFVRGDPQKGCVLLLHGYRNSRRQMLPVMQCLAEARFTVLAVSLPRQRRLDGRDQRPGLECPARRRGGRRVSAEGVSPAAHLRRGPLPGGGHGDLCRRRPAGTSGGLFSGTALQGHQERDVEPGATLPAPGPGLDRLRWPAAVGPRLPADRSRSTLALRPPPGHP